jgi:hypothetical protein
MVQGLKKFLAYFDLSGGEWVGVFSASTLVFAWLEYLSKGWIKAPEWWFKSFTEPGVYGFVLALFAANGALKLIKPKVEIQ